MLGHDDHIDQDGFQERPPDSDFINLFQVSDRIPAIVAGGDNEFGAGGQNLVPLDFQTDIALLAIASDSV